MYKVRMKIRKHFEVFLIRIASKIVLGRNVQRSMVVSRRDNNRMFEMGFELKYIADRMLDEYNHIETY